MISPNVQINREVGWVPEVIIAVSQDVFRCDGDESADGKRPERAALWLYEQCEADPADVRALQVDDLAAVEP